MATPEKYLKPDNKGRINLGTWTKDIVRYKVEQKDDGTIILFPEVAVPINEAWLYKNKKALNAVMTGITQAKENKTRSRGSFAQYVEEE